MFFVVPVRVHSAGPWTLFKSSPAFVALAYCPQLQEGLGEVQHDMYRGQALGESVVILGWAVHVGHRQPCFC